MVSEFNGHLTVFNMCNRHRLISHIRVVLIPIIDVIVPDTQLPDVAKYSL